MIADWHQTIDQPLPPLTGAQVFVRPPGAAGLTARSAVEPAVRRPRRQHEPSTPPRLQAREGSGGDIIRVQAGPGQTSTVTPDLVREPLRTLCACRSRSQRNGTACVRRASQGRTPVQVRGGGPGQAGPVVGRPAGETPGTSGSCTHSCGGGQNRHGGSEGRHDPRAGSCYPVAAFAAGHRSGFLRPRRTAAFAAMLAPVLPGGAPALTQPVPKTEPRDPADLDPGDRFVAHRGTFFGDPGLDAGFTDAVFSHPSCTAPGGCSASGRRLSMATGATGELNALALPPPSPFTFTVTLAMDNEEGLRATGPVTFRTHCDRRDAPAVHAPPPPLREGRPTPVGLVSKVPPGDQVVARTGGATDTAGTNARFAGAKFPSLERYSASPVVQGLDQRQGPHGLGHDHLRNQIRQPGPRRVVFGQPGGAGRRTP